MRTAAQAIARLESSRSATTAGAEIALERPATRHTATTRPTPRCGWRARRKQPPRAIAEEPSSTRAGCPTDRARRDRRPRVRQPLADALLVRRRAGRDPRGRGRVRRRLGGGRRRRCRWRWCRPTRRARSRWPRPGTAPTATRSRDCSSSRGTRSSASTTTTTPARRWRSSAPRSRRGGAGRSLRRTATRATTSPSSRSCRRTRCRRCSARSSSRCSAFRIHFDSWAKQSELEKRLPEFLPRLDTYEKDGAVWARSSAYGDEDDRVLVRSEGGTPTYRAADVVYLADKLDRGLDRAIYVLGADHHGTRNWYAAVARMLGYDPDRVEVLLYQLVHLTKGGEQAKMSKRRGDVVFLDDFIDEVGIDAARWYLVSRGPDQAIDIDVDLAGEKSASNPVYYVQYAHARIAGILRNAEGAAAVRGACRRARPRGARPDQAAGGVPRSRRGGDRAARPARDPDLRDPRRGRLPPLLPPPQGARLRGRVVPARARHRDEVRDRPCARLDRRRSARHHVGNRGEDGHALAPLGIESAVP